MYVGVRIPDYLVKALDKIAEEFKTTRSEIIRNAIENHTLEYQTGNYEAWKIIIRNFFGVDQHKILYALSRSNTVDDFFSFLSKWTSLNLTISPDENEFRLQVTDPPSGMIMSTSQNRNLSLSSIIAQAAKDLEQQYVEKIIDN